jgi:hypothetical protein
MREGLAADLGEFGIGCKVCEVDLDAHNLVHVGVEKAVTRTFSLSEASRLEDLFREAGFSEVETHTVQHTFVLPTFGAYYGPFERGGASTGQALAALPDEIRRAVRDEVRRDLGDAGGPIEIEAEYRIAGGRR